ncbi:RidA family protein [Sulfitobacter mediterraneus]|uniref:Enamine deaminase RidA (YjgF/YER057c/UK114 family) n=1 Tax=Sulfitobacter mediterraneus TaxID=83219 RepID=A0A2T6CHA0_9RHOB|nr:RidA family protein [Sulfitobacter mediterraneus]KIN77241.1 Endoribonuclease L-PSP [Sulfitobacter mediterraneus KCTC 32188]PTX74869.1 enamine deaminase RidA (YjgF/YER057c/UK114 family) [Sulfitobacter mediterraneus]
MPKRAIIPAAVAAAAEALNMSPGIVSGDHLFLTGTTGSGPDGAMPSNPTAQFEQAFAKIGMVLAEAGPGMDAIVEMTSYHVGLRDHFDDFDAVRLSVFKPPYPAWTAVEVAGIRREGAVVEIRVIASMLP